MILIYTTCQVDFEKLKLFYLFEIKNKNVSEAYIFSRTNLFVHINKFTENFRFSSLQLYKFLKIHLNRETKYFQ